MGRIEVNRSGEMEVFVKVVDADGFSAAARAFRMTPSAVSKLVARLEERLGARLVNRSTRRLQLTPEGASFYERSVRLLADLDEAERSASANDVPSGRLRVNANVPVATHILLPLVADFLALHPAVNLDLALTDTVIDLMEEKTDVALRSGPLKSSRLIARKLGETRLLIVGAPSYFARYGAPATPADLERHIRLSFCYSRAIEEWPLIENGVRIGVAPSDAIRASDGEALRHLAIGGAGLARLAYFQVKEDIAAGRLAPVLEEHDPGDVEAVHAVYLGQGGRLPARVRAFLDFLAARARIA